MLHPQLVSPPLFTKSTSSALTNLHTRGTDYLVTDNTELCKIAYDRGSLEKLVTLAKSITPLDTEPEWDMDEPESVSCLREARSSSFCFSQLHILQNRFRQL